MDKTNRLFEYLESLKQEGKDVAEVIGNIHPVDKAAIAGGASVVAGIILKCVSVATPAMGFTAGAVAKGAAFVMAAHQVGTVLIVGGLGVLGYVGYTEGRKIYGQSKKEVVVNN